MQHSKMNVTVAIVTKDRPNELRDCLRSLMVEVELVHQLIIVDASEHVTFKPSDWPELPTTHILAEPGITKQRNIAMSHVDPKTDILLFIDDDVIFSSDTLSATTRSFQQHTHAAGITAGLIMPIETSTIIKRAGKIVLGWLTQTFTSRPFGITFGLFNIIHPVKHLTTIEWLPGAFMAYRYESIAKLQFDEWFTTYGLGEDLDFSLQAGRTGELLADPAIHVTHTHTETGRNWERFGRMRVQNRWYIYNKHFRSSLAQAVLYGVGYIWSTALLVAMNMVRSLYSARYRAECRGELKAIFRQY